jgi:xylan 1,4-beta-xylosidase
MAHALGHPDAPDAPPDINALAALNGSDKVQVLLVSHHDDWDVNILTEGTLEVSGLEPGRAYCVQRHVIDATHSNAHTAWLQMGEPQSPTMEQLATLQRAAMLARVEETMATVDRAGCLTLALSLREHSVNLLELYPM